MLRELLRDGRISIRALAEIVHVSRANAYARLDRLVDTGIIRSFSARLNHDLAGLHTSAYVTVKYDQTAWRDFRAHVSRIPSVHHAALVGGDFDIVLLVRTSDNAALRDVILNEIQTIPGVITTRTLLIFEELIDV
jgi:DNA-binding Lrp family transcriptional regulator